MIIIVIIVTFLEISKSKINFIFSDNLYCLYSIPIENIMVEIIKKGIASAPNSNESKSVSGSMTDMINAGKIIEIRLKTTTEIVQINTIGNVLVISDCTFVKNSRSILTVTELLLL